MARRPERAGEFRVRVIAYTQRANIAAAQAKTIAARWPALIEQSQQADKIARRRWREMQVATALDTETARRGKELEQAIAANSSIQLTERSS